MEDIYSRFPLYGSVFVSSDEDGIFNRSMPSRSRVVFSVTVKEWEIPLRIVLGDLSLCK